MKKLLWIFIIIGFIQTDINAQKKSTHPLINSINVTNSTSIKSAAPGNQKSTGTLIFDETYNISQGSQKTVTHKRENLNPNSLYEVELTTSLGDADLIIGGLFSNGTQYRKIRESKNENLATETSYYELLDLAQSEVSIILILEGFKTSTCRLKIFESPLYSTCTTDFWFDYNGIRQPTSNCEMTYKDNESISIKVGVTNQSQIQDVSLVFLDVARFDDTYPFEFNNIERNLNPGRYPVTLTLTDICGDSFTRTCTIVITRTTCATDFWFDYNGTRAPSSNCEMTYAEGTDLTVKVGVTNQSQIRDISLTFRDQVFFDDTYPFQFSNIERNMAPGRYPITLTCVDVCGTSFTRTCTIVITRTTCTTDFWFDYNGTRAPSSNCEMTYAEGTDLTVKVGVTNQSQIRDISLTFRDQVFFDDTYPFQFSNIERNMAPGRYPISITCVDVCGTSFTRTCIIVVQPKSCEIQVVVSDIICHNNNTPSNSSDDTYTFNVTAQSVSNGGSQWEGSFSNGFLGAFQIGPTNYGEKVKLGPFPAGTFTSSNTSPPVTVTDGLPIDIGVNAVGNFSCSVSKRVDPPSTCSNTTCTTDFWFDYNGSRQPTSNCEMTYAEGTDLTIKVGVTNQSQIRDISLTFRDQVFIDDTYPFQFSNIERNMAPGRYPISITCVDVCGTSFTRTCTIVVHPRSCEISIVVSDILCHDNNTSSDPTDDTYTFNVTTQSVSNGGSQWEGSFSNAFLGAFQIAPTNYGDKVNLGPFPAGSFTSSNTSPPVTVTDGLPIDVNINAVGDFTCTDRKTISPPATCSNMTCRSDFWFVYKGTRASDTNCELIYSEGHDLIIKAGVENASDVKEVTFFFRDIALVDNEFPFEWHNAETNMSPGRYPVSMTLTDHCGRSFTKTCVVVIEECELIFSEGHDLTIRAGVQREEDVKSISLTFRDQVFFDDTFPFEWIDIEKNMSPGRYPLEMTLTDDCDNMFTRRCTVVITERVCNADIWFDYNGERAPTTNCEMKYVEGHNLTIKTQVKNHSDIESVSLFFRDQAFFDDAVPFEWPEIEKNMSPGRYPISMILTDICGNSFTRQCTIVIETKICETDFWFDISGSSSNETIDESEEEVIPSAPKEEAIDTKSNETEEAKQLEESKADQSNENLEKKNVTNSEDWTTKLPAKKTGLMLMQNNPNPFQKETIVKFYNPIDSEVQLLVFDMSGKLVSRQNAFYKEGWHESPINASQLKGSGVYIYELNNGEEIIRKKMMTM